MRFLTLFTTLLLSLYLTSATTPPRAPSPAALLAARDPDGPHTLTNAEFATLVARQDLTTGLDEILLLLSEVKNFLTAGFLNDTYSLVVNAADLLADPFVADTRAIITEAGSLISALSPVISELGNVDISGLISSLSGLLTTDSINGIKTLLANAEALLTSTFVNQTQTLIADVEPLVASVAQFITALLSALLG